MSIATHVNTITTAAAQLDTLVAQFRTLAASIDAAELAIRQLRGGGVGARAGQSRLSEYAASLMVKPSIASDPTVTQRAAAAWAGVA